MSEDFQIPTAPENLEKSTEKGYFVEEVLDVTSLSKNQLLQVIEGKFCKNT